MLLANESGQSGNFPDPNGLFPPDQTVTRFQLLRFFNKPFLSGIVGI
jgi:hypothetical protein